MLCNMATTGTDGFFFFLFFTVGSVRKRREFNIALYPYYVTNIYLIICSFALFFFFF